MNEIRSDIIRDENAMPMHLSAFDDMMADDLKAGDIVMIDGNAHQFVMKVSQGPHVFWDGNAQKHVNFSTVELFDLQAAKRYYRPGRDVPSISGLPDGEDQREKLKRVFAGFRDKPKAKAKAKWFYVAIFIARMKEAEAKGETFPRNKDNALAVIKDARAALAEWNQKAPAEERIEDLEPFSARSLLRWVAREVDLKLQETGLLHGNSMVPRKRKIPQKVYDLIAVEIREMVELSYKLGPTKIHPRVEKRIDDHNAEFKTALPRPSLSTVHNEYRRYSAWARYAAQYGIKKADLEYGAVGKLERPKRILDEVELDHHLFDLHPVSGALGETTLGIELAKTGLDRFWVCLALDVHSNYPLGFAITFEPGGLIPALMCIDHSIRPKTYVQKRWPEINGDLLGFGKPVKFRYDNAKEFVSLQLQQNLAKIQVGFELAIPGRPDSKPYVERHFGTVERGFVHWLAGSTGANIFEKGDRRPQSEAKVGLDDFLMLFHQYLIEVYARQPQAGLDNDTPEQRWLRGMANPSHRPRRLTSDEESSWDLVTCITDTAEATREGVRWKNIFYQSEDLQSLRDNSGAFGLRKEGSTPVSIRVPLLDISQAYVVPRTEAIPGVKPAKVEEVVVYATNPHVQGRTIWQHEAVCDALRKRGKEPLVIAEYKAGFLRLFDSALRAMGAKLDGKDGKVRNTGGQAPRFAGVFLDGPSAPALSRAKEVIERYDILKEHEAAQNEKAALPPGNDILIEENGDEYILENDPIEDIDDEKDANE